MAEARLAELKAIHDKLDRIVRGKDATWQERADAVIAVVAHISEIRRRTRFLDSLGPETPVAASETPTTKRREIHHRAIGSLGLATST